MKSLLAFLFLSVSVPPLAYCEAVDRDLQAVITSPMYAQALAYARKAVAQKGDAYVLTLGNTSELHIKEPKYFFYLPVYAVRVPLSPDSQTVGNIVAELEISPNAPLPAVSGLWFEPVAEPPGLKPPVR
jgi:hypothetical protein